MKVEFMTGIESAIARTTAYPIRWVKLVLLPRVRCRYELMMARLTSSRRAGTSRKLVAVGTPRLASMLATMRAAAPRIGSPNGFTSVTDAVAVGAVGDVRIGSGRAVITEDLSLP